MSAYRGIRPKISFESEIHPLRRQQFAWFKRSEGLEAALYAGKEMLVCINDDGQTYELTYLDFAHPQAFASVEDAKEAASDFARAVLLQMLEYVGVREDDHSLRNCLLASGQ